MIDRLNRQAFGKIFGPILLAALLAISLSCAGVETKPARLDERERLKEKVDQVIANGELNPVPAKRNRFTEAEVNTILNSQLVEWIPNGIIQPQVRLLGNREISLRLIVDIDEFKRRRPGSAGPLNLFSGKLPALVRGDLIAGDGKGQFKLQSVEMNGIPLPRAMARRTAFDAQQNQTQSRRH